jgi:hypothetical protein
MTVVVAAVVRSGRNFLGSAAVSVVGDVGGECEGAPRPFGFYAIMITHARVPSCFSVVGSADQ